MDSREPLAKRITTLADSIEAELKGMGQWQAQAPSAEALRFKQPYAADTMSFFQWLQFIFLPRVRDLVNSDKDFPRGSEVAKYADKKLAGDAQTGPLLKLLGEFDAALAADDDFYAESAGRRRMSREDVLTIWTAVLLVLGTAFALVIPQWMPPLREEIVSFSGTEPAPSSFDLLAFALVRDGPIGQPRRQELRVAVYRDNKTAPSAGLAVDPQTLAARYRDANGQPVSTTLTPEVVLNWFHRNGVDPTDPAAQQRLKADAADVVQLAKAAEAQALEAMLKPDARIKPSLEFSAPRAAVTPKPAKVSPWLRWGLPAATWLVGMGVIWVVAGRRSAPTVAPAAAAA